MKRRFIYNVVYALTALLVLGACQEEDWSNHASSGKFLTLELNTTAKSRVPVVGDDRFNENEVKSVDVYFFHNGQENTATAVDAQIGLIPEGSLLQVELNENITDGDYYIYVVANIPKNTPQASDNTLAELKERTITTVWKSGEDDADVIEPSFVMDGYTTVTVNSEGASGHVKLTRAMAKVMLYTSTEKELNINGMTYEPVPERMFVTMYNSVTKTNLADNYQVNANADYQVGIRRNYDSEYPEEVPAKEIDENADEDAPPYYRYEQMAPFYSYPNPEATVDRKNAYLMLCVPWTVRQSGGDGSYQAVNYYYRVPITGNADPALMMRNQYYRINVHIGVLGSVNPEDAVEITNAQFEIYDWFEVGIDTDMQQYQYLVLDEYSSVMNNVEEIRMPYISSSPLKIVDENENWGDKDTQIESVTYANYYDINASENGYASVQTETSQDVIKGRGYSITEDNGELIFRRVLSEGAETPYVPDTIKVRIWNMQELNVEWTIIYYPARYIVGDFNPSGDENRFVYGSNDSGYYYPSGWGWAQNGGDIHDDNNNDLGGINNPDYGATNNNKNQYTVYITSFGEETSDYAIGDPRVETPDENLMSYIDAKSDRNNEHIKYYYPTRREGVENVIAPAFKIASSWGVISSVDASYNNSRVLSYETAQRRCASYQENGYPAGRWRIPTESEIEYIIGLSDRGVMPSLFDGDYYASSGRYFDNESNPSRFRDDDDVSDGHSVRCVYDVWYWGNKKIEPSDQFTWGDEPMRYN